MALLEKIDKHTLGPITWVFDTIPSNLPAVGVQPGDFVFDGNLHLVTSNSVLRQVSGSVRQSTNWYVDANIGSNSNDGLSWDGAFLTMAKAFTSVSSGDTIYLAGKIKEQLVTPVQKFDVSVIGIGNRPRHADSTPAGGELANSTWAAPDSPVASQALVRVLQQGWRFQNILWSALTGAACIELVRNAASSNDERDASHAVIVGNRFAGAAGAGIGIKFGATSFTEKVNNAIVYNNDFQDLATGISNQSADLCYRGQIVGNRFTGNTNHITAGLQLATVTDNMFGVWTTTSVNLTGGAGSNIVTRNYLYGDYSTASNHYVSTTGDEWSGNWSSDEAETEVINAITTLIPAA